MMSGSHITRPGSVRWIRFGDNAGVSSQAASKFQSQKHFPSLKMLIIKLTQVYHENIAEKNLARHFFDSHCVVCIKVMIRTYMNSLNSQLLILYVFFKKFRTWAPSTWFRTEYLNCVHWSPALILLELGLTVIWPGVYYFWFWNHKILTGGAHDSGFLATIFHNP